MADCACISDTIGKKCRTLLKFVRLYLTDRSRQADNPGGGVLVYQPFLYRIQGKLRVVLHAKLLQRAAPVGAYGLG